MTRNELIKLAVGCHWYLALDFLERQQWCIYPGDANPGLNQTVNLWDGEVGISMKHVGHCQLSELRSGRRPWIIGPFSGKFFSLKSMRIW